MRAKLIFAVVISVLLLTIACPVMAEESGSKVQIGSNIYVPAGEEVHGDSVAIFGGQKIEGKVSGSVVTIFGDLELSGEVDDDVVTIFGKVIMAEGARITGDMVSVMGDVERAQASYVGGEYTSVDIGEVGNEVSHALSSAFSNFRFFPGQFHFGRHFFFFPFNIGGIILTLLGTLLIGYFFMKNVKTIAEVIEQDVVRTGVKGLIGVIVVFFGSLLLAITIIGIPVAMILGMVVWVATVVGSVAVHYLIGVRLAEQFEWEMTDLAKALLGALVVGLIAMLPLGGLITMVVGWLGFGGVIDTKFGTRRPWVE